MSLSRRRLLGLGAAACFSGGSVASRLNAEEKYAHDLIESISEQTLRKGAAGHTWFHPRPCMLPWEKQPTAFMTMQPIMGSDHFGHVHWSESNDLAKTWSEPKPIPSMGHQQIADDTIEAVCDVVPEPHPRTKTVLALGHNVFYRTDGGTSSKRFFREQPPRRPVYCVRNANGKWSPRKTLLWDDPRGAAIYTNNCGQRVTLPGGDILLAFTFGDGRRTDRAVVGVRCSFDGQTLKVLEVGPELRNAVGRGLLEPSMTQHGGKFFLTIRAEDNRGYVASSDDGLHWSDKQPWMWEDGEPLNLSTTQQHWLSHSAGLYLAYTRKAAHNINVIRWRAPIYVAAVNLKTMRLVRDSERVALPLVGDGVNKPNQVPLMGNFQTLAATPQESWITVGQWRPRGGITGDVLLSRIRWRRPNESV